MAALETFGIGSRHGMAVWMDSQQGTSTLGHSITRMVR